MQESISKDDSVEILTTVSYERGFHFNSEKDVYTGTTAISLSDFAAKLETIDVNSILFHFPRGDFQTCIQETLGDKELANRMDIVPSDISGENLRKQLIKIVHKRLTELKNTVTIFVTTRIKLSLFV